jgi:hypothetical protein
MTINPTIGEKFATENYAPLNYSNSKLGQTNLMTLSFHNKIRGLDCGLLLYTGTYTQCFGSGSGLDQYPDSESDPDPEGQK